MTKQKTMAHISYGLETPKDLMGKLLHDASKMRELPDRYDLFNFFVTAAVMYEWCHKYYNQHQMAVLLKSAAGSTPAYDALPPDVAGWIEDKSCLPNSAQDERRHIVNALRICIETANASKHYQWLRSSEISAIEKEPEVKDWYQYFFTSSGPGLYVEYSGEYYTVEQISGILVQFFRGFLRHVDSEADAFAP